MWQRRAAGYVPISLLRVRIPLSRRECGLAREETNPSLRPSQQFPYRRAVRRSSASVRMVRVRLGRSPGEELGPPNVRPLKNYPLTGRTRVSSELSIPHRSRILCVSLETQPNSIALDALRFASDDWKQTDSPSGERFRLRRGQTIGAVGQSTAKLAVAMTGQRVGVSHFFGALWLPGHRISFCLCLAQRHLPCTWSRRPRQAP